MNNSRNLVDTAAATGSFKTFGRALSAAGLTDTLKGAGPYTVFAPTDAAFAQLPAGRLEHLMKPENKAELASILTCHVTPGRVARADVVKLKTSDTVNGQPIEFKVDGEKLMVGGALVTSSDMETSNGIIHTIDTVILPKSVPAAAPAKS